MPIALVFDQNPAVQALAGHALKQLGYEPVSRTGSVLALLEEFDSDLLICSTTLVKELCPTLKIGKLRVLFIAPAEVPLSLPNSAFIKKPFSSEQLLTVLKTLTVLDCSPVEYDIELKLNSVPLEEVVRLGLGARGLRVAPRDIVGRSLITLGSIKDASENDSIIKLDLEKRPLSETLFAAIENYLPMSVPEVKSMPLGEGERELLSKMLVREIESKLSETNTLRSRDWTGLRKELHLVLEEFFKR
jgi:hypothetical protein